MAKNSIDDLRDHLFETLERLKDTENPMELDRALAISKVSQTIIESAKVEVKFADITGELHDSGAFFKPKPKQPTLPQVVPARNGHK